MTSAGTYPQGESGMKYQSIEDLLYVGLTYVYDFEQQIAQTAPKMAEASSNPELKQIFQKTESKSKEYAQRVQQAFAKIGKEAKTNDNHVAKAMIHEVEGMIANTDPSPVRDAALIVAANQQQLFRVASYGSLKHYAELLGKNDVVQELEQNLHDSKGGDEKLTRIGETQVNKQAAQYQPRAAA